MKDLRDLTELMPINAASYYRNLTEKLEINQSNEQNDSSFDEHDEKY